MQCMLTKNFQLFLALCVLTFAIHGSVHGGNISDSQTEWNLTSGDFVNNTTQLKPCSNVYDKICEESRSNDSSQDGLASITSPPPRRGDRYGNGQVTKDFYTTFLGTADPLRFFLHCIAIPLLFMAVLAFVMQKPVTVTHSYIVVINGLELLSNSLNFTWFVAKYTTSSTSYSSVIVTLMANYGIVCCRRSVYVLNLVLCVQRLMAVLDPIRFRNTFGKSSRNIVFLCVMLGIPVLHIYLAVSFTVIAMGPNMFRFGYSKLYEKNIDLFETLSHIGKIMFSYVPLALGLFVNFVLVVTLKRYNDSSKNMRSSTNENKRSSQERQTTLMILVSTLLFTILSLPPNINHMVSNFIGQYGSHKTDHYLFQCVKALANAVQTLGDITNFLTYFLLSASFRRQIGLTLCPGIWKDSNLNKCSTNCKQSENKTNVTIKQPDSI